MPTFRAEGPGGLHGPVLVVLCDPGVGGGRARPDRTVTLGSLCPLWAGLCSPTPALLGLRDPVSSGESSEQRRPCVFPFLARGRGHSGSLGTHSADFHTG